ncbi:MAG: hypothetical protein WA162_06165 [Thermodesulfobacteriota bacterium]
MDERLRPVSIGILIGLVTIIFGIGWAFFVVTQHDRLHASFEADLVALKAKFVMSDTGSQGHHDTAGMKEEMHDGKMNKRAGSAHKHGGAKEEAFLPESKSLHDDPLMEIAHKRLVRGHLHAMGLGILSIVIAFLLASLDAPLRLKTIGSVFTAMGGLFYPMNWIIMGFRTTSMGADASEASVMLSAGSSMILVLTGVFISLYYLARAVVKGRG